MTRMPDREALAKAEMAATRVGRGTSWVLVAAFLALLASGVALQPLAPLPDTPGFRPTKVHERGWSGWLDLARERGGFAFRQELRALLRRIDRWSENDLVIVRRMRLPTQRFLLDRLRFGNSQVRVGPDGWLFYEREIDSLTGPPFLGRRGADSPRLEDPDTAILGLATALRARGVTFAAVPAPAKSSIEIARLLGSRAPDRLLRNPAFGELARRLEGAGVVLFDPAPALLAAARRGEPVFLRTDSHWRPETVDHVAAAMAAEIFRRGVLERPATPLYRRTAESITGHPDLVALLGLPHAGAGPLYEPVTVQVVRTLAGEIFQPVEAHDAPVLLLGDSLAGNYGWGGQGYGSGAGLAEQLAYHLQTPVQAILEPAGGGMDSRERLAQRLRRGHGPLAGKRLVILEFAERELAIGRWRHARFGVRRPAGAAADSEPDSELEP